MDISFLLRGGWVLVLAIAATDLNAQTSLFVDASSSVYVKSLTVSARGHVTNNGTINANNTGVITFNGTSSQNLDGGAVNTTSFARINISNSTGVTLGTNINVFGTTGLDFTTGSLTLNNSSIRFASGSSWATNTTAKFFITNGAGMVYANNTGVALIYPVGVAAGSANYKPVTLTNSGTADAFGVRVQPDMYLSYNNSTGAGVGSPVAADAVALTWIISEVVPGGSTLLVTPQWNTTNETAGFVRGSSMISYYDYATSKWIKGTIGGTSGANPYTKSLTISPSSMNFMPLTVSGAVALPISLLAFDVSRNSNNARISWTTASETNNDYFEIQRSDDAVSFKKIGVMKGAGNSVDLRKYEYTDSAVPEFITGKTAYYRLQQVDFDGQYSHSPIRVVHFDDTKNSSLLFYPNPTQRYLTILYNSEADNNLMIDVVNSLGIQAKQFQRTVTSGDNTILVDLEGLSPGIYTIVLNFPNAVVAKKIIVSE